jgi:lipocalin
MAQGLKKLAAVFVPNVGHSDDLPPLQTVKVNFNSDDFLGTWYKRYGIPNSFERNDAFNVTATYSRNTDSTIKVTNTEMFFRGAERHTNTAIGQATLSDGDGKLHVSFDPAHWFKGDYWVVLFEKNCMFVSEPKRAYGWVLTRTPTTAILEFMRKVLAQGFTLRQFQPTGQDFLTL